MTTSVRRLADLNTGPEAIAHRTQAIIDGIKNRKYGDDGWAALHGILCMAHGWELEESLAFNCLIDLSTIAARMNEISCEQRRRILEKIDTEQRMDSADLGES